MSYGVDHRGGSDLALLWLRHRLAAAAPIHLVAWIPPRATGAALKKRTNKGLTFLKYKEPLKAVRPIS